MENEWAVVVVVVVVVVGGGWRWWWLLLRCLLLVFVLSWLEVLGGRGSRRHMLRALVPGRGACHQQLSKGCLNLEEALYISPKNGPNRTVYIR